MGTSSEPRNPFYILLLVASFAFAVTAVAYAVVPVIEEKAREAGNPPPPSVWRKELRENGWKYLLYQLAAMIVFGFLSMGLDRYRRLQNERASATISQDHQPAASDKPSDDPPVGQ